MAAAEREVRRLARGSEASPAYAQGLAYLETLADLPWSRWGLCVCVPAACAGAGSENRRCPELREAVPCPPSGTQILARPGPIKAQKIPIQ